MVASMNRNEYLRMRERRIMIEREPTYLKIAAGVGWAIIVILMVLV
jgi:hypothetical protein